MSGPSQIPKRLLLFFCLFFFSNFCSVLVPRSPNCLKCVDIKFKISIMKINDITYTLSIICNVFRLVHVQKALACYPILWYLCCTMSQLFRSHLYYFCLNFVSVWIANEYKWTANISWVKIKLACFWSLILDEMSIHPFSCSI